MESLELNSQFWHDRPTFVTGATGLVGSWLVKYLIDVGANIVCLVRDWVPNSEIVRSKQIEKVQVVRGDIRDIELLERILGEYEIQTIFHLAAQTIVTIANLNPLSTFETNIQGTWNILEASRRSPKVEQIVIASSDKAYGDQKILPYYESAPLQGQHPYDVSKSCADLISQTYAKTYDLPVIITRCGNFFGGGDLNWNRIIPGTIRSILRKNQPIIRSNGKFVRDYLYVEDGVLAYLMLAQKLSENSGLSGQAFNFSYEMHFSVYEIVEKIRLLMDSDLMPIIKNETNNEIIIQYLDSSKARELLGWQPKFDLSSGLELTIKWYMENFK